MPTISRFEQIEARQSARTLTQLIYQLTNQGEFRRDFGLRDQIRRASVSVMSNIAEGFESRTSAMFIDYLGRAKGSAGEVRSQVYVAYDVGYLDRDQFETVYRLVETCRKKISRFMLYLETRQGRR